MRQHSVLGKCFGYKALEHPGAGDFITKQDVAVVSGMHPSKYAFLLSLDALINPCPGSVMGVHDKVLIEDHMYFCYIPLFTPQ